MADPLRDAADLGADLRGATHRRRCRAHHRDPLDRRPNGALGADATAIGLLIALAVLAVTVGLIRSETPGDMRTLTAAGAGTRTRRWLVGTTAAALGLLGALLGIVGARISRCSRGTTNVSVRWLTLPCRTCSS